MTTHNIFHVKQNGKTLYECINTKYNDSNLTLINTINTKIYIHNNLQLHINNDSKEKKYIKIDNSDYFNNNNILIQKILISPIHQMLFPLIKHYDNIIMRQTKIYHDKQTNIYINFICDTFTNNNNKSEKISYLQLEGDFTFGNITDLLNKIF